jgi:hypothetical protein
MLTSKCALRALYTRGVPFLSVKKRTLGFPGFSLTKVSTLFYDISTTLDVTNLAAAFFSFSGVKVASS